MITRENKCAPRRMFPMQCTIAMKGVSLKSLEFESLNGFDLILQPMPAMFYVGQKRTKFKLRPCGSEGDLLFKKLKFNYTKLRQ